MVAFAVLAMTCLATAACDKERKGNEAAQTSSSPAEHSTPTPDFRAAYAAGYKAGKDVFNDGGKGVAVREVLGGGCTRRALEAEENTANTEDRGAWVQGCQDGVSSEPSTPPDQPVTKREANHRFLDDFQAWARDEGNANMADHATGVATVELVDPHFDVEVSTDYSSNKVGAEEFAETFAKWWDGDDGEGVARNLIILDAQGQRIVTMQL
ncbi:hypothetical protein ACWGH4_21445 [Streptomyces sp. NPDC054847]